MNQDIGFYLSKAWGPVLIRLWDTWAVVAGQEYPITTKAASDHSQNVVVQSHQDIFICYKELQTSSQRVVGKYTHAIY